MAPLYKTEICSYVVKRLVCFINSLCFFSELKLQQLYWRQNLVVVEVYSMYIFKVSILLGLPYTEEI
jgi:hypothetical protein